MTKLTMTRLTDHVVTTTTATGTIVYIQDKTPTPNWIGIAGTAFPTQYDYEVAQRACFKMALQLREDLIKDMMEKINGC